MTWPGRRPHQERILRRRDSARPAGLDEPRVVGRAAALVGPLPRRPQVVVPRCPDDPGKARRHHVEHEFELGQRVAGVAGEDQPVVAVAAHGLDGLAVGLEADVDIADRPERHGTSASAVVAVSVTARSAPSRATASDRRWSGGGPRLPELPALGPVVEAIGEADGGRGRRPQHEGELAERDRQPHAARLDVGLLERPVLEEGAGLRLCRQGPQVAHLVGREVPPGDVLAHGAIDALDIDADLVTARHGERDQAGRVREVEHQPRRAGLRRRRRRGSRARWSRSASRRARSARRPTASVCTRARAMTNVRRSTSRGPGAAAVRLRRA